MKKILIAVMMSSIGLTSIADMTFNYKIPQPNLVTNDWDGDGLTNDVDTDDDGDNIPDTEDDNPFSGRPVFGGASSTPAGEGFNISAAESSYYYGFRAGHYGTVDTQVYKEGTLQQLTFYKSNPTIRNCTLTMIVNNQVMTDNLVITINDQTIDYNNIQNINRLSGTAEEHYWSFQDSDICDITSETEWNVSIAEASGKLEDSLLPKGNLLITELQRESVNRDGNWIYAFGVDDYDMTKNTQTDTRNYVDFQAGTLFSTSSPIGMRIMSYAGTYNYLGRVVINECDGLNNANAIQYIKDNDGKIVRLMTKGFTFTKTPDKYCEINYLTQIAYIAKSNDKFTTILYTD